MEKINLHNYEAFFLDYSEGSLTKIQVEELMDFLKENPSLQAELEDSFEGIELVPAFGSELDKSFLKKEGIQEEEVEELMIASIEGQLSKEQEYELTTYVSDNSLQKTFSYFKNTILVPNVLETYGNKSELKKRDAIIIPLGYRIAAAAAVVVLFFGLYLNNNLSGEATLSDSVQTAEVQEPNQFYPKENLPNANYNSRLTSLGANQHQNYSENNFIAEKDHKKDVDGVDTVKIQPGKLDQENLIPNNLANNDSINSNKEIPSNDFKEDDIAIVDSKQDNIVSEEPIKFITNLAGNVFNKDVSYQRDKNTESDQYVAHHFKLGRFEFERKKH